MIICILYIAMIILYHMLYLHYDLAGTIHACHACLSCMLVMHGSGLEVARNPVAISELLHAHSYDV